MKLIADISLWWSIPILILSGAVAYFLYYSPIKKSTFSSKHRILLTILRTLSLFLIGVLLLGIFFIHKSYREEKPLLFVALDQSESMLNYADSTQIKQKTPSFIQKIKETLDEKYKIKTIGFGGHISDTISKQFKGTKTNIGNVFEQIHEKYIKRNIGAVVLISDGNHNEGIQPIYSAKQLNFVPIFSVGVGDTILKKDLSIHAVFANKVAFSDAVFPIAVKGKAHKMKNQEIVIKLLQNGDVIDQKKLQLNNSTLFNHQFIVKAKGKGYQRYTVKVESKEKEYTLTNNSKTVYVEIIDERKKALLIANSIHPDIGAIRSVLEKNKNIETEVTLAKEIKQLPKCDIVVYYNPTSPYKPDLWKAIYAQKKPVLIVLGSNLSNKGLQNLNIGVTGVFGNKTDRTQASFNQDFTSIHFSETFKNRVAGFPPLKVAFANSWTNIGDVLLYQTMEGVNLHRSLLSVNNLGGHKTVIVYGQGLWMWKLSEQKHYGETEAFNELISKLIQYLSVKQNTSKLRVYPPKNISNHEVTHFRAEFYNDAFQLITNPKLKLSIKNEAKKIVSSSVFSKTLKDYQLNLGKLHPGKYFWSVSTQYGNKKYTKSGEFVVNDFSIEKASLNADFRLLNELAVSSKGKFFTFNERQKVIDALANREEISAMRFEETAFDRLIDYKLLFFLIILLLSLEWSIKRWLGSY